MVSERIMRRTRDSGDMGVVGISYSYNHVCYTALIPQ